MKICPKCGTQGEDKFCYQCGEILIEETENNKSSDILSTLNS